MPSTIFLLICLIACSKEILPGVHSNIINIIPEVYEGLREILDKSSTVTKVRTTAQLRAKGNELATLDFIGLVQQYDGYQAEEYDVQTEDGYILKLHRITSSPLSPKAANKPVIFMQHGVLCSSEFFVVLGPRHDLAYMLADAGYDIWLGNARGTTYSRRHVKYSPTSTNYDFWKFTIDDLGLKDAPALIDAVLEKTNKTKLIYIGHSLGTTMNYMLLSSKPKYNDKILLSISMAPVVYFIKPYSLFLDFCALVIRPLLPLVGVFQFYELLPLSTFVIAFAKTVCTNFVGKYLCGLILSPVLSFHNVNLDRIASIFTVALNGVSLNIMKQFGQLDRKEFRKFNFGSRLNKEKYNSSIPPIYDLSKVTAPQAIFYAAYDTFINVKSAEKVKNHLPNVISFEKLPDSYRHLDYVWAGTARNDFYYEVLNLVKKYSQ